MIHFNAAQQLFTSGLSFFQSTWGKSFILITCCTKVLATLVQNETESRSRMMLEEY